MADKIKNTQGLLATITRDHAFDEVVRVKVFSGDMDRMRMETWFNEQRTYLIDKDKREDPTFDAYGYSLESREVTIEHKYEDENS